MCYITFEAIKKRKLKKSKNEQQRFLYFTPNSSLSLADVKAPFY